MDLKALLQRLWEQFEVYNQTIEDLIYDSEMTEYPYCELDGLIADNDDMKELRQDLRKAGIVIEGKY